MCIRDRGCLLNEGKEIVSNGFAAQSELADLFGRPGASHPARLHIGDAHIYRIPGFLLDVYKRQVLPSEEEFPYAIRTVSETMESNGSTSQALSLIHI